MKTLFSILFLWPLLAFAGISTGPSGSGVTTNNAVTSITIIGSQIAGYHVTGAGNTGANGDYTNPVVGFFGQGGYSTISNAFVSAVCYGPILYTNLFATGAQLWMPSSGYGTETYTSSVPTGTWGSYIGGVDPPPVVTAIGSGTPQTGNVVLGYLAKSNSLDNFTIPNFATVNATANTLVVTQQFSFDPNTPNQIMVLNADYVFDHNITAGTAGMVLTRLPGGGTGVGWQLPSVSALNVTNWLAAPSGTAVYLLGLDANSNLLTATGYTKPFIANGLASTATNRLAATCLNTSATAITNKLTTLNVKVKYTVVAGTLGFFNNAGQWYGGLSLFTGTDNEDLQPGGYITNTSGTLTVNAVSAF